MHRQLGTVVLLFACLVLVTVPAVAVQDDALHVGVFPRRNQALTEKLFAPLARYLEAHLQRKVVLESAPDFAAFWASVADQRFDLVHFNQYQYLRSHRDHGYRVILRNEEFSESTIAATLLVRQDSGIERLEDLRGKKIVFGGGRMAMISFIVPVYLLRRAGLREGDYAYQFALTPPKAAFAVYYHQAAAAGTGHRILDLPVVRKEIDVDNLRIISRSEPLAHLPWAVSTRVDEELGSRIQGLMVALQDSAEGRRILRSARVTGFVPARDSDYDPHRRIVREVLDEQY